MKVETSYSYEVRSAKGVAPLCVYTDAARAWQHVDDMAPHGVALSVEIVTVTTRREPAPRPRALRRVA